ncbi:MAG: hypothetical protein SGCHY_004976, partial [Lobulomycetales sp.]
MPAYFGFPKVRNSVHWAPIPRFKLRFLRVFAPNACLFRVSSIGWFLVHVLSEGAQYLNGIGWNLCVAAQQNRGIGWTAPVQISVGRIDRRCKVAQQFVIADTTCNT